MWEINNSLQSMTFLRSLVFGLIIKLVYDFLRSITVSFKLGKISILISDVIFMVFLMPFVFGFLLVTTNGFIRAYVIFGIILGIIIFSLTVSRLLKPLLFNFFSLVYNVSGFICRKNEIVFDVVLNFFNKILRKALFLLKKSQKYLKKLLKKR